MRPLAPRGWETQRAIEDAKKRTVSQRKPKSHGNVTPWFNGSGISKRNKKRPITLPERA